MSGFTKPFRVHSQESGKCIGVVLLDGERHRQTGGRGEETPKMET